MSQKLENKVAVITGATSGMALATAKLFVEEGAYVFITGRRQKNLDEAVSAIGKNVMGILCDSANLDDLDRLFDTVKIEKGHIDILFASAGYSDLSKPIGTITEEHFETTFSINTKGTLFTVQKALPLIKDGSSIILNSSIANVKGFPGASVYAASKAANRSFARTWAAELKERNIRVNALSPGSIETGVFDTVPEKMRNDIISQIPLGRLGRPEEIAKTALFLASEDASFITGIELTVDGGVTQV